jgi:hypothetical protein
VTATKLLRCYSHFPAHIRRTNPRQLFLLTVEARPIPGVEEVADYDGAFVNCWVNADDLQQAEQQVLALLPEHGWQVQQFESWQRVTREAYLHNPVPPDAEGTERVNYREFVDLALLDGIACLTHVWSDDSQDDSRDDGPDNSEDGRDDSPEPPAGLS